MTLGAGRPTPLIPAKAGIHGRRAEKLGPRLRGDERFLGAA
jgi:hypothetical protein